MIRNFFLLIAVVLVSCSSKSGSADILSKKTMRKVLWEMIQANAYINGHLSSDSSKSLTDKSIEVQKKIFKLNNITREQFKTSFEYYKSNPDMMNEILDSISVTAEKQTIKLNKINKFGLNE